MKAFNSSTISQLTLSLLFMAAVPVFIKFTSANAYTIGIVRLVIAASLSFVFILYRKEKLNLNRRDIYRLMLIGIIFSIHWITYFISIKISSASIAILGASTYGIHLILLGWFFLKIKPGLLDWLAIAIAIGGTLIIFPEFTFNNDVTLGLSIAIVSGLFFAMLPILHQRNQHIKGDLRALGQYVFAMPLFLLFSGEFDFNLTTSDWGSLFYLGFFGTFLAHTFWINVTTKLPTTFMSLAFYIVIPITMTISHFWLNEQIGIDKLLGAALIIMANFIGVFNRISKSRRKEIPS